MIIFSCKVRELLTQFVEWSQTFFRSSTRAPRKGHAKSSPVALLCGFNLLNHLSISTLLFLSLSFRLLKHLAVKSPTLKNEKKVYNSIIIIMKEKFFSRAVREKEREKIPKLSFTFYNNYKMEIKK